MAVRQMLWKERSRIRAVQMDNIRRLLGIRKMDMTPNAQIRELCCVKKGLRGKIDEGVPWCSTMWRGWRVIGLPRESMVVVQRVGLGRDGLIP